MFGEYAKMLQNHGKSLEDWLGVTTNWHHMWKESIAHYDSEVAPSPLSGELPGSRGYNIPLDLAQNARDINVLIKGLQSTVDKLGRSFVQQGGAPWKAGGKQGKQPWKQQEN